MTTSNPRLWSTRKSLRRMDHAGERDPVGVPIVGTAFATQTFEAVIRRFPA